MDLAKFVEVKELRSGVMNSSAEGYVNERLAQGWHLITAKVVEAQFRVENHPNDKDGYIRKQAEIVYVLGKPRTR